MHPEIVYNVARERYRALLEEARRTNSSPPPEAAPFGALRTRLRGVRNALRDTSQAPCPTC